MKGSKQSKQAPEERARGDLPIYYSEARRYDLAVRNQQPRYNPRQVAGQTKEYVTNILKEIASKKAFSSITKTGVETLATAL